MAGSASGLLFLRDTCKTPNNALYICNPITREYINQSFKCSFAVLGFGVSKTTDQYKVVWIYHEVEINHQPGGSLLIARNSVCRVYTLGTGSWRSVLPDDSFNNNDISLNGAFLNGNLHWLVRDIEGFAWISCFDLETELFKAFPPPPPCHQRPRECYGVVTILRDHICLCDNTSKDEIVIWIMKEYGLEKSWTKEIVISKLHCRAREW